ncbi:MAG TPA: Flp family type IVb pilin [Azospira sp.]|nr:Flp family type IVb pilin [Azospira sp.]
MKAMLAGVSKFFRDEDGVTAIEYGVLASLIILAVVATVVLVGQQLNTVFEKIKNCLSNASTC